MTTRKKEGAKRTLFSLQSYSIHEDFDPRELGSVFGRSVQSKLGVLKNRTEPLISFQSNIRCDATLPLEGQKSKEITDDGDGAADKNAD